MKGKSKTGEVGACKDLDGNAFTIGSGNKGKDGDLLRTSKEVLMARIAGAINAVATQVAVGINEVPSGLARALNQHAEGEGTAS